MLPQVVISEQVLQAIVDKLEQACPEGHRADLAMYQTVRTVAAFHGRTETNADDVDEAAYFVLPHRAKNPAPPQEEQEDQPDEQEQEQDEQEHQDDSDSRIKIRSSPPVPIVVLQKGSPRATVTVLFRRPLLWVIHSV